MWPASVILVVLGASIFAIPFVSKIGEAALVAFSTVSVCGCFFALTYFVGSLSGVYLYMLVVPPAAVVVMGTKWRKCIIFCTLICSFCVALAALNFWEPALPAASIPPFQNALLVLAVFLTASMITVAVYFAFLRAEGAEDALEAEYAKSEALLYNLLPEEIAARLKVEPDKTIADSLPKVAILFADIVQFTPRSAAMKPEKVVDFLNRVFSRFDALAEKYGLEKIKTIGDAYMVAAGMPNPCGDPVHRVAEMALDMLEVMKPLSRELEDTVEVRVGLHAGPAVAGVIGNKKLFYDVWGETVNTASRMESHGEPGRIQVTGPAYEELASHYCLEERGKVEVKGMGEIETWWLVGRTGSD